METENKKNPSPTLPTAVIVAAVILSGSLLYRFQPAPAAPRAPQAQSQRVSALEEAVLPSKGILLPIKWGDLGRRLTASGVIDSQKFTSLYKQRGQWTDEYEKLLKNQDNGSIIMTRNNAGYLLNLFWALGIANKNQILETGEMSDPKYGGAGRFSSTGGWTMAKGSTMEHYSQHDLIELTATQQSIVEKLSKGIFRPCCGNSTHFPDCNHGMAMLALLELMASQGVGETEMWKAALSANSFWFPDTYVNIAAYKESLGVRWSDVDPREVLGADYSSSAGARRISQTFNSGSSLGGSGCGVGGTLAPARVQQQKQSGCSI